MQKFMEHLKQQAKTTYVPSGCAEKILEEVGTGCQAQRVCQSTVELVSR